MQGFLRVCIRTTFVVTINLSFFCVIFFLYWKGLRGYILTIYHVIMEERYSIH